MTWNVNDIVYVPRMRLGLNPDGPSALIRTKVLAHEHRTVTVDVPGYPNGVSVGTSAAHKDLGLLILSIGDYATEMDLITPLTDSVLSCCRLLLPPDGFKHRFLRSTAELEHFWDIEHSVHTHVVIIAHGGEEGLKFGVDGLVHQKKLVEILDAAHPSKKKVISLCCGTGRWKFAHIFSRGNFCDSLIAPFHSIHGAVASQFLQVLLAHHFLDGRSFKVAYNKAQEDQPSRVSFRFWQNGVMK